eukprot:15277075-Alexandrium_andersonii.AAC.1
MVTTSQAGGRAGSASSEESGGRSPLGRRNLTNHWNYSNGDESSTNGAAVLSSNVTARTSTGKPMW